MQAQIHDVLALCRYEQSRLEHTIALSTRLRRTLYTNLTELILHRSKNRRNLSHLREQRQKLVQHNRVLKYGSTAKYIV